MRSRKFTGVCVPFIIVLFFVRARLFSMELGIWDFFKLHHDRSRSEIFLITEATDEQAELGMRMRGGG